MPSEQTETCKSCGAPDDSAVCVRFPESYTTRQTFRAVRPLDRIPLRLCGERGDLWCSVCGSDVPVEMMPGYQPTEERYSNGQADADQRWIDERVGA